MDTFDDRVREHAASMPPVCRKVAAYMNGHRAVVLASSAAELAGRIGTSDASVIRTVQRLGFAGLGELKQALVASVEQGPGLARDMRRTLGDVGDDSGRAVDEVLNAHDEAMQRLREPATRTRIGAAVSVLDPADTIAVFGIGPSAGLASYVMTLLTRAGRRTLPLTSTGSMLADQMLGLRSTSAVLALAYGRAYPEIVAVFKECRRLSLPIVLVTDSLDRKLSKFATVILPAARGRAERIALHGATLVCLEALVFGLGAADKTSALTTLDELSRLRAAVRSG